MACPIHAHVLVSISVIHERPVRSLDGVGGTTLKNEEMGIMSALKASALLHLPEDVKKEFNGTIGYS